MNAVRDYQRVGTFFGEDFGGMSLDLSLMMEDESWAAKSLALGMKTSRLGEDGWTGFSGAGAYGLARGFSV